MANPLTAPTMFVHLPNPHLITGDDPLALITRTLNWLRRSTSTLSAYSSNGLQCPRVPEPPLPAVPQLQPPYIPPWPPAQSGTFPPMPPAQPAPPHQSQCLSHQSYLLQHSIKCHLSHHLQHHPSSLGKPIPQVEGCQCPLTFRPPCSHIQWLPSSNGLSTRHTMWPTGWLQQGFRDFQTQQVHWMGPHELHPFIVSCIMAFDSRPCKFVTDRQ